MRPVGYDTFDWVDAAGNSIEGYTCGLPPDWSPVPSIAPSILARPGTTATFGVSSVTEIIVPGKFSYRGPLSYEAAWSNLFKRLDPVNQTPRELRIRRNDNVLIRIRALVQPLAQSSSREINFRDVNFIAVDPFWTAVGFTTGTGGFS